ncbi:MAG: helix-turn-helix transcriptional regulator [Microbacterium arborescens]
MPALTPREASVAREIGGGKTYAEIADGFVVSINTVKSQMRSLFAKLGVSTRDEAVAALERHGFYL